MMRFIIHQLKKITLIPQNKMKAFIFKERIRISPVPKEKGWSLCLWLKKPLTKGNKPFMHCDINVGQKFYSLPCEQENILSIKIARL